MFSYYRMCSLTTECVSDMYLEIDLPGRFVCEEAEDEDAAYDQSLLLVY